MRFHNVCGQRYIGTDLDNHVSIDIYGTPGNDLGAFMNGVVTVYCSRKRAGRMRKYDGPRNNSCSRARRRPSWTFDAWRKNLCPRRCRLPCWNPHEGILRQTTNHCNRRNRSGLPWRIHGRWSTRCAGAEHDRNCSRLQIR